MPKKLVMINNEYYISNNGESLIPSSELDLGNDENITDYLFSYIDARIISKYLEDFKEYFPDFYNITITEVDIFDNMITSVEQCYNKAIIVLEFDSDDINHRYKQLYIDNTLSEFIPSVPLYENANDDDMVIDLTKINNTREKGIFFIRQKENRSYGKYIVMQYVINKLKELNDNGIVSLNELLSAIVIWNKSGILEGRYNSYSFRVENELKNERTPIRLNRNIRNMNRPAGEEVMTIPIKFKNNLNDIDFSNVDTNSTSEVNRAAIVIWNNFENCLKENMPCFIALEIFNKKDYILNKEYSKWPYIENDGVEYLFMDPDMEWYFKRTLNKVILETYIAAFKKHPNNCKILNKLIRLYYNKGVIPHHRGAQLITWFAKLILIPEIRKGVDVQKKFKLTSNNMANLVVSVF